MKVCATTLGETGGAAVLIACLLGCVALAHFYARISKICLFWLIFVLTRSFGATLGDLFTKTHEKGGLNFGTVGVSAVLTGILGLFVLRAMRNRDSAVTKLSPVLWASPMKRPLFSIIWNKPRNFDV